MEGNCGGGGGGGGGEAAEVVKKKGQGEMSSNPDFEGIHSSESKLLVSMVASAELLPFSFVSLAKDRNLQYVFSTPTADTTIGASMSVPRT